MLELSGPDRNHLREALTSGFRSYSALKRLADGLDVPLNLFASSEAIETAADNLIEYLEERGEVLALILALRRERPKNAAVQRLIGRLNERLPGDGTTVRKVSDHALAVGGKEPHLAYLIIAVFWEKRREQTFRVQPKLCYQNTETRESLQAAIGEGSYSVVLKDFPDFLKRLIGFTITELVSHVPNSSQPWQLTISLFVPVDLLHLPLTKWCGQDGELLTTRPVVLGCSDLFDPDEPGRSADLHNQLRLGWQRFQAKVPDNSSSTLQNLKWLSSDLAHQKSFQDYSGFRCYGDWLKPDDQHLENWQELVRSGIPLALWMYEGSPSREAIAAIYNDLTNCTRFEFIDRIRIIRDEQRKTYNHCLGVFYEDPSYVPEIPKTEEKRFFSWPGA